MTRKFLLPTVLVFALSCNLLRAQDTAEQVAMDYADALSRVEKDEALAQKPRYWHESAVFDVGVNTTQLSNWAAGGYNTLSFKTALDANANYAKDLMSWNNRLQMDYGFFQSDDKKGLLQKNADRLYFESRWGYRTAANSKFKYAASIDFKSQFSNTKENYVQDTHSGKWDGTLKSGAFSPAYANIALGIDWDPNEWFDISIAPLTGGFTICTIEELRSTYGMPTLEDGSLDNVLFQFGAQIKANFKTVINDVLRYETQVVLFTDYLSEPYCRVNWDNSISWQLSKLMRLSFKTWMIYDPNVTINGEKRLQFKDFLTLNFTYSIRSK